MVLTSKIGRIAVARLPKGSDLLTEIERLAEELNIKGALITLIGALEKACFGIYVEGKYKKITLNGPLEIVSCLGNIAVFNGKKVAHVHIAVSNTNGEVYGGHLLRGCIVNPTAEIIVIEGEKLELKREVDEETGLKLLIA